MGLVARLFGKPPLEQAFTARLRRLDPLSPSWLLGVAWRFEPKDPMSWPKLFVAGERKSSGVAQPMPMHRSSSAVLEGLLQSGDTAYGLKVGAHADFSPTLPMLKK